MTQTALVVTNCDYSLANTCRAVKRVGTGSDASRTAEPRLWNNLPRQMCDSEFTLEFRQVT